MTLSASDVSDELIRRLQAIGFEFRDDDNQAILNALSKVDLVRHDPGASQAGEIIWQAEAFDGPLMVIADGKGGARLEYVEGNYPIDYITKDSRDFDDEELACRAAQAAIDDDIEWDDIFECDENDLIVMLDELDDEEEGDE